MHTDYDDLIQETFAACMEGRCRLRDPSRFRSYLFGTAYNVLRNHYHHKRRGTDELDTLGSLSVRDLAPGPSTLLRRDEQQRLLVDALHQIPLELQVAVELSYWECMTSAEIGYALGVPAATIRTRLRRARQLLADALDQLPSTSGLRGRANEELDVWARRLSTRDPIDPPDSPDAPQGHQNGV